MGCAAIVVAGCGSSMSGGAPGQASSGAAACSIPVTRDQYDGYQAGVPAGWSLSRVGGALVVTANSRGTVEAVLEPAVLTSKLTPSQFYTDVTGQLEKAVTAGDSLNFRTTGSPNGLPEASVTGQAGGNAVSGEARVSLIGYRTAHGSQLVVFSAYWAPPAQLASQKRALAAVATCYRPEPATLFQIAQDQQFTYPIPLGWRPSEAIDELSVADGQAGAANYLFALAFPSEGVTDVPSLLRVALERHGITIDTVLNTASSAPTTTVTGATAEGLRIEFTGTHQGTQIHGVASVQGTTSSFETSGVVRWAYARVDLWNSLSGALLQIAGGIQHHFTQDLQEIARLSQEWQNFGHQVQGFDDALNGVDLVRDPSTGKTYEAPYARYQQSGPAGPGYYIGPPGSERKLQIITP